MTDYSNNIKSLSIKKDKIKENCISLRNKFNDLKLNINELIDEINDGIFCISVVGHWNNGKSTFINALIGDKVLSTNYKESTCRLTGITYNEELNIKVIYKNGKSEQLKFDTVLKINDVIKNYTDKNHLASNEVDRIVVGLPLSVCKEGISIIDTPGVKSINKDLEMITHNFVVNSDLVLFIFNSNTPGNSDDFEFIKSINKNYKKDFFFIINRADEIVHENEKNDKLNDLKLKIIDQTEYNEPPIFMLSSLYELQAKRLIRYKSNSIIEEPESKKISFYDNQGKHRFLESIDDSEFLIRDSGFEPFKAYFTKYLSDSGKYIKKIEKWQSIFNEISNTIISSNQKSIDILNSKKNNKEKNEMIKKLNDIRKELDYEKTRIANQLVLDLKEYVDDLIKPLMKDKQNLTKYFDNNISDYKTQPNKLLEINETVSTKDKKVKNIEFLIIKSLNDICVEVAGKFHTELSCKISDSIKKIRDLAPELNVTYDPKNPTINNVNENEKIHITAINPVGLASSIIGTATAAIAYTSIGLYITTPASGMLWWSVAASQSWNPIGWAIAGVGIALTLGGIFKIFKSDEKIYNEIYGNSKIIFLDCIDKHKILLNIDDELQTMIKEVNKTFNLEVNKIMESYKYKINSLEQALMQENMKNSEKIEEHENNIKYVEKLLSNN